MDSNNITILFKVLFHFLQFLINGESSPIHQSSDSDFVLPQTSLLPNALCIKTEATLTPVCSVKQERTPVASCNVKPIQPMPVTSVPVSIQKTPVAKPAAGIVVV